MPSHPEAPVACVGSVVEDGVPRPLSIIPPTGRIVITQIRPVEADARFAIETFKVVTRANIGGAEGLVAGALRDHGYPVEERVIGMEEIRGMVPFRPLPTDATPLTIQQETMYGGNWLAHRGGTRVVVIRSEQLTGLEGDPQPSLPSGASGGFSSLEQAVAAFTDNS